MTEISWDELAPGLLDMTDKVEAIALEEPASDTELREEDTLSDMICDVDTRLDENASEEVESEGALVIAEKLCDAVWDGIVEEPLESNEETLEASSWGELTDDSALKIEDKLVEIDWELEADGPGVIKESVEDSASEKLVAEAALYTDDRLDAMA